ncbi:hypothetical protein IE81DRAFT_117423 [Ceraceosorus guamensis]|uniref:Uncharacterized protein n=1 Tax=Ceraceosorus guamensis TaxID=1522189 RepID=A0A316W4V3_9BASI|nr:hypothetical protein IE81DRAFT_117423 [Ceraceosorus guamensis]PWN42655.1 hypothetical protein IE81DRAFT_117423 [Ceraceosorus guamensis]
MADPEPRADLGAERKEDAVGGEPHPGANDLGQAKSDAVQDSDLPQSESSDEGAAEAAAARAGRNDPPRSRSVPKIGSVPAHRAQQGESRTHTPSSSICKASEILSVISALASAPKTSEAATKVHLETLKTRPSLALRIELSSDLQELLFIDDQYEVGRSAADDLNANGDLDQPVEQVAVERTVEMEAKSELPQSTAMKEEDVQERRNAAKPQPTKEQQRLDEDMEGSAQSTCLADLGVHPQAEQKRSVVVFRARSQVPGFFNYKGKHVGALTIGIGSHGPFVYEAHPIRDTYDDWLLTGLPQWGLQGYKCRMDYGLKRQTHKRIFFTAPDGKRYMWLTHDSTHNMELYHVTRAQLTLCCAEVRTIKFERAGKQRYMTHIYLCEPSRPSKREAYAKLSIYASISTDPDDAEKETTAIADVALTCASYIAAA